MINAVSPATFDDACRASFATTTFRLSLQLGSHVLRHKAVPVRQHGGFPHQHSHPPPSLRGGAEPSGGVRGTFATAIAKTSSPRR